MRSLVLLLCAGCAATTAPQEAETPSVPVPHHSVREGTTTPRTRLVIPEQYVHLLEWDPAAFEDTPILFEDEDPMPVSESPPVARDPRRGARRWSRRARAARPFRTTGLAVSIQRASGHPMGLPGHSVGLPGPAVKRPGQAVGRPEHPANRPAHAVGRPGQAVGRPEHPVKRPGHAVDRPGHPVEQPEHPVRRPKHPVKKPEHPVKKPGQPLRSVEKSAD